MNCSKEGVIGTLNMQGTSNLQKRRHPADGARARVVTNRYNLLEVELTASHGQYSSGTRLQIHPSEFLTGMMAGLKAELSSKK